MKTYLFWTNFDWFPGWDFTSLAENLYLRTLRTRILKSVAGDTQKEFAESVVRAAITDTLHKGRLGPTETSLLAEKLMLYSYVHGLQRH